MTRRLGPIAAIVAALMLLLGPALLPVDAQNQGEFLEVLVADARVAESTQLTVAWTGTQSALEQAVITEQGEQRKIEAVEPAADGTPAVVLVIDNSEAMDAALADAKRSAIKLVENLPEGAAISIVGIGNGSQVARGFTRDPQTAINAIDSLVANGLPAVADGLRAGAALFADEPDLQPNVVLITGTTDGGSAATFGQAKGDLSLGRVNVQIIGIAGGSFDQSRYQSIVDTTGGRLLVGADSDSIVALGEDAAAAIGSRYRISFPPVTADGDNAVAEVSVAVGDVSTEINYIRGSETIGAGRLAPIAEVGNSGIGFLQNGVVKYLAVALAAVAAALASFSLVMVFQRDDSGLSHVLQPYADGFVESDDDKPDGDRGAILQRAVDMTEDFAERQGFLAKVEAKLERAALPLRAAEAMLFYAIGVVILTLLAFVLSGNLVATLLAGAIVAILPSSVVNFKAKRRKKAFVAQLPDMLSLLSGTLRAGYSLMQGVEAVSKEVGEPIGVELRRVVTEARLGRPLEEAMDAAAERMESEDFTWAVMAVRIQREVGGNLAELLMTVAETMVQRERLRRDVDSLTAEGKISAIVLGLLTPGIAGAMFVINPEYIGVLFSETIGNMMLGFAVCLATFGFWWMKKCTEIDI